MAQYMVYLRLHLKAGTYPCSKEHCCSIQWDQFYLSNIFYMHLMFKFVSENRKKIISGQGQQNQFIVHHLLAVLETDMDSKVWHGKGQSNIKGNADKDYCNYFSGGSVWSKPSLTPSAVVADTGTKDTQQVIHISQDVS